MPQTILKEEYFVFEKIPTAKVGCALSSRKCGNMSLSYGDIGLSLASRKSFLEKLGIDYRSLICAKQIHADKIRDVYRQDRGRGALSYEDAFADTDAFVTSEKNVPLAIFTADCLSVFLYDPKTEAIGLAHAGWRSSKENISGKTVKLMQDKFGSLPGDILVGLGAALRSCCYEVGSEFLELFPGNVAKREEHYYLDLVNVNKQQLLAAGIREANIFDSGICTSCRNQDYFSFRREKNACGRMMSVMMLK